ncbi:hypothetical protein [Streptomyces sp. N35]|uniref:Rv1733c family protein n=1 Tax=Streptomyces sp. N35 TaxID=2795730 RepID=UPI0018F37D13|nr:hypothetical protein [Streptomyces sp. N35]
MNGRVRFWRLRRNELRRRSDLADLCITLLLAALLLVGAPTAAVATAQAAWQDGTAESRTQASDRHAVTARLIEGAPAADPSSGDGVTHRKVHVRWHDPDGTRRTATIKVPAGTDRGAEVAVWLDTQGRVTEAPLSARDVTVRAVGTGAGTALGIALGALVLLRILRIVSLRRRLAEWEDAWARTAPTWDIRRS